MLIIFAFPIADLRQLVSDKTYQLKKPTIPAETEFPRQFIRNTGAASVRLKGGSKVLAGEDLFCQAKKACLLPSNSSWMTMDIGDSHCRIRCVFRRFFRTGISTSRFEIGFRVQNKTADWEKIDIELLIKKISLLYVRVGILSGLKEIHLVNSGNAIAEHFRIASTYLKHKVPYEGKKWWCSAGQPLVVIELNSEEKILAPRHSVSVDAPPDSNVKLYYSKVHPEKQGILLRCWFLNLEQNVDIQLARQLRIHLVRIHGEIQCLKRIVQLSQTEIMFSSSSLSTDRLKENIEKLSNLLRKQNRYGTDQKNILHVAYESHQSAMPGELTTILSSAKNVIENIEMSKRYSPAEWEKKLGAGMAVFIIMIVAFLVIRNEPLDPNLTVMIRILISLSVSVFGAVIPGFLNVSWKGRGFAIRAGGALALFVLTFMYTPTVLSSSINTELQELIRKNNTTVPSIKKE